MAQSGNDEPGKNFNSRSLGLRMQKKILGKMATKKMAKAFIDEDEGALLDALQVLALREIDVERKAKKIVKNVIKIAIKLALLYRNDQFNADELALGEQFKSKFRQTALTVVSFHEVEFTYDRAFLEGEVSACEKLLHDLIRRHLTEKSHGRVTMVFEFFRRPTTLDNLFKSEGPHRDLLDTIAGKLNVMLEQKKL
ncbi:tumor necrosis factor alpha-induced protein 8-like [Oscarella lobularis]|uniref:tumor necrosis factor alpha-induced protein 8-like n=1 Tax=Oscarella lobularis TaxID=121494 RepID=UPI0033140AAC